MKAFLIALFLSFTPSLSHSRFVSGAFTTSQETISLLDDEMPHDERDLARNRKKRARKDRKSKKSDDSESTSSDEVTPPADAVCIRQADFATGTLIIDTPGSYRLCEDITFNPNPPSEDVSPVEAFEPTEFGDLYDENSFGLGFFAAIAIATDNVDIYLDGYTLEQSKGHALMQRFYANIELNNSPFIANVGPARFVGEGDTFRAASNVRILGPGTLGRSSHHGIHGNNNANIEISNVTFRDFEVAAVSINNVDGLQIINNKVKGNRKDVPVTGMFSAAKFISPYGAALAELGYEMQLRGQLVSAAELHYALVNSINNVYDDVVHGAGFIDADKHPEDFELYDNPFKVIDGPCYAFLVHGIGPAVGGQGMIFDTDPERCSSDVVIQSNHIDGIKCWTKEIPAAVVNGVVQNDARGAVFQWVDTVTGKGIAMNDDGTYKGNVVADMQVMVAKAIHEGVLTDTDLLQTGVNTIDASIVEWAESADLTFAPQYRCDGDSMHHVNKGIIAIRVEDTEGFTIQRNKIHRVQSVSVKAFTECTDYHAGQSPENIGQSQLGDVRGISIAATRRFSSAGDCKLFANAISDVDSEEGNIVIGIDIQGESSGINIARNQVDLRSKQKDQDDETSEKYIGLRLRENVNGSSVRVAASNKIRDGIENLAPERRLRNSFPGSPHGQVGLEWEHGGCPFAKKRGTAHR